MTDKPDAPVNEPNVPPVRKSARRRIATLVGCLSLAGAVVSGVGFTVVTVNGADRGAGAPVWEFHKTAVDDKKAPTTKGLADALVPYGSDGWTRGPDLGGHGSDVQLSGPAATALRKESLSDLPRTLRKKLEKEVDRQELTGMAMRSYVKTESSRYNADGGSHTVSIVLFRMKSRAAVRDNSTFRRELLGSVGLYRKGPEIKGHKNAGCFLRPQGDDGDLETMFCSAYEGDVLVSATADGAKPLDTQSVAALLRDQLDRMADPGEAV